MEKASMIDRWIKRLSSDANAEEQSRAELLELLSEDYYNHHLVMRKLEAEASHLVYPHLVAVAADMVKQKEIGAAKIKKMISRLGGSIDPDRVDSIEVYPTGEFSDVLKLEGKIGEELSNRSFLAEDCGLEGISRDLHQLKGAHFEHQAGIELLIMKTNASL